MQELTTRTTNLIRHLNEVRCLRLVRRSAPLSRAEVARSLNLTRATAGKVVADLLERQLLIELSDPQESGKAGRPGRSIALNPDGAYFVGVDISSRWISGISVDFSGRALSRATVPNAADVSNPHSVAQIVADLSRRLVIGASVPADLVRGVGVSIPGIVDRSGIVASARLLGWQETDLASMIAENLGAPWPIQICNDAVALASAVGALDTGQSPDILVLLLSEGIGSALIRNGQISEGASGFAGEVGHMVLAEDIETGATRTFGTLGGYSTFLKHIPDDQPVDAGLDDLAALIEIGEPLATDLDRWARILSVGLANLIHILDPARIVLGGPLAGMFRHVREQVEATVGPRLLHGLKMPPIDISDFAELSVAVGAANTIRETIFLPSDRLAAGISLQ